MSVLVAAALIAGSDGSSDAVCAGTPSDPGPSQAGQLVEAGFESAALGGCERYAVYLPPGYAKSRRRYPVIYALHGLPSPPDGYLGMGIDGWGRDASAAGRPAIVVAPQGARADFPDPEWHDWGPGRNWETLVAKDLVEHVDATLRTIRDRRARALIGVSAGGYGASIIALHHPRTFSVAQSWSGYFRARDVAGDEPLELGSRVADAAASVHSYIDPVHHALRASPPLSFGFFVGARDAFAPENEALHHELAAAGVPHSYALYPGDHTTLFWLAHQGEWVRAAVDRLTRA